MDKVVTLDHGAGGLGTEWLVNQLTSIYGRPSGPMEDSAILSLGGVKIAFTTDLFVVDPPIFRGGDIGKLSVCGTVNDLVSMGAKPLYLSLSMVLEEGLSLEGLGNRITFHSFCRNRGGRNSGGRRYKGCSPGRG